MDTKKLAATSLGMDELDRVSGGNFDECINDMMLLEKKTGRVVYSATARRWGIDFPLPDSKSLERLKSAFADYGVKVVFNLKQDVFNEYYIGDEEVCRQEVWEHIEKKKKI